MNSGLLGGYFASFKREINHWPFFTFVVVTYEGSWDFRQKVNQTFDRKYLGDVISKWNKFGKYLRFSWK